jgi:hypothetical protein
MPVRVRRCAMASSIKSFRLEPHDERGPDRLTRYLQQHVSFKEHNCGNCWRSTCHGSFDIQQQGSRMLPLLRSARTHRGALYGTCKFLYKKRTFSKCFGLNQTVQLSMQSVLRATTVSLFDASVPDRLPKPRAWLPVLIRLFSRKRPAGSKEGRRAGNKSEVERTTLCPLLWRHEEYARYAPFQVPRQPDVC